MHQNRLVRLAAVGIHHCRVHFVKQRKVVEVALHLLQRGLAQRVAGVQRNGFGHRIRPRVVQAGQQHLAHKNLRAFVHVNRHIDLRRVLRLGLLLHVDLHLVEAAAHVVGQQRVAVASQALRRKQLPRRGIHQRLQRLGRGVIVAHDGQLAHALLRAFINVIDHVQRVGLFGRLPQCRRVGGHFRRDFGRRKSVVLVGTLQRIHVGRNQPLAIGTVTVDGVG